MCIAHPPSWFLSQIFVQFIFWRKEKGMILVIVLLFAKEPEKQTQKTQKVNNRRRKIENQGQRSHKDANERVVISQMSQNMNTSL